MNARVLFILLVISVLLAFTRRYRQAGLVLSAVLVALLLWFSIRTVKEVQAPIVVSPATSSVIVPTVSKATAQLSDMQLTGNGAPWRIMGTLQNTGSSVIHSVSFNVERLDCPSATATSTDCLVLWQGARVARIDIAAAASVKIDERFYSHDEVPRLQRIARDRFTLTAVE